MRRLCDGEKRNLEDLFERLSQSKFRSGFHLKEKDKKYVLDKGGDKIREHARDFVSQRLAPAVIPNDGKQTPMKGHPIFIAQHATACCCRGCLYKWYRVERNVALTPVQQQKIVKLIMAWIEKEMQEETR